MSGRSPAGPLMREHRVIERMVAVLRAELGSIRQSGRTDPVLIDAATDFIRTYADRCHHGKEEDILFRRLAAKDLEAELARAMEDLIQDHVSGRAMTKRLVEANLRYRSGEREALASIEEAVHALVEFYPAHIEKEDRHFFKPCLEYFDEAERVEMLRDFDEFDRAIIHDRYRAVAEDLEQSLRQRSALPS